MKRSAWKWAVVLGLAAGLGMVGCAKKQVREDGGLASPAGPSSQTRAGPRTGVQEGALPSPSGEAAAGEAAASRSLTGGPGGPGGPGSMRGPGGATPSQLEPPPAQTAAVERVGDRPVAGGGLAGQTAAGLQRIHFDFDQSALTPDARDILAKNSKYLEQKAGLRIRIEGHCDERGTTEYNLALGERRAKAAYQYLMDLGVDPNRMNVVSYGEEVPLDAGHNEAAWAQNRRAEFVEVQR